MFLAIDFNSEVPLYQQLRDQLVVAIATGVLPVGSSLPATRRLAAEFGINFHTVNKTYSLLRQEGLIRLTRKQGAVVQRDSTSGPPATSFAESWDARARTLLAEAFAQGLTGQEILATCQAILAEFERGADSSAAGPEGGP
jgi:DNA-binding transcriptional regulator YhcF (GntR family)